MPAKTLNQVALEDMRIPGVTDYPTSYAINTARPMGRRANGNFSSQFIKASLIQGRYAVPAAFTPANPDFFEISWNSQAVLDDYQTVTWDRILPWNHIYLDDAYGLLHSPGWINNSRALWFGFECWIRSASTGAWSRIIATDSWDGFAISPPFDIYQQSGAYRDLRTESNGMQSVKLVYDSGAPYNTGYWAFHGWPGGITPITGSDVGDVLVFAKISLVVDNPALADDRLYTRYAVAIGADYYGVPKRFEPGVGTSRHKPIAARWPEWQWIVMHTMTEGQMQSIGLPDAVRNLAENFEGGGVVTPPPEVNVPAGPAPSASQWLDTYVTSTVGQWVDIAPQAAVAPAWRGAPDNLFATIGEAFSFTPTVGAGLPAPTYSKISGPTWASVNATTAEITGTPTGSPESTSIVLRATNASGTADLTLLLEVVSGLQITIDSLPPATVGMIYEVALSSSGPAPVGWAIASGSLPAGLQIVGAKIVGVPTSAGTYSFTVQASASLSSSATQALTIAVAAGQWTSVSRDTEVWTRVPRDAEVWIRVPRDT